jgi:hypothetical protein
MEKGIGELGNLLKSCLHWYDDPTGFFITYLVGYALVWWKPLWGGIIIVAGSIAVSIINIDNAGFLIFALPTVLVGVFYIIMFSLIREAMKHLCCFHCWYNFDNAVTAQNKYKHYCQQKFKNSFYFEFLGNGAYYSLNYDRAFPLKKSEVLFLRIGGATAPEKESDVIHPGIITEIGILSRGDRHFFDAGLGYAQFLGFPDRLVNL